mgnify:CR=1 FL=1
MYAVGENTYNILIFPASNHRHWVPVGVPCSGEENPTNTLHVNEVLTGLENVKLAITGFTRCT